jgi:hypothetical protein
MPEIHDPVRPLQSPVSELTDGLFHYEPVSFGFHASAVCNESGAIRFAIAPYGLTVGLNSVRKGFIFR